MVTDAIGLSAGRNSARVLVTRRGGAANLSVEVTEAHGGGPVVTAVPIERWRRHAIDSTGSRHIHWAKPTVDGLQPGTRYDVVVVDGLGNRLSTATITTAPPADCARLRLAAGSCFDVNGDDADVLDAAYRTLVDAGDDTLTYNLWLGDQVYLDAPWQETTTTARIRGIIYDRYLRSWGITERSSLGRAMRGTSNWYLPDDHEFWNGYPHPSWLTLFWHTAVRFARQAWRAARQATPHPASQGTWGSTAGEAYATFASTLDFDRFDESVSPPQLQTIETDQAVVVLVDTRWHRTIQKSGPGAGFMQAGDLERLIELLTEDDRLVCLALAKPIIGNLPHRGVTRRKVEYGPEDYGAQYTALWAALAGRRRAGHPTLAIGGDLHQHSIRTADDNGLLEVVSSPLSILAALDNSSLGALRKTWVSTRGGIRKGWSAAKGWFRQREESLRPELAVDAENAYPSFEPDGSWIARSGEAPFEAPEHLSGFATIDLAFDDGAPVVTVRHVLGTSELTAVDIDGPHVNAFRWETGPTPAWRKL